MTLSATGCPIALQTFAEIRKTFPRRKFKKVATDLGDPESYLDDIVRATDKIDVQVVFNNAGYLKWGFFVNTAFEDQLKNLEVNLV